VKSEGPSAVRISVIIPFRDAARYLERSLRALRASSHSAYELILVDDGSTDDSAQIAHRYADHSISLSESHGPAYARNRGAEQASGGILFFTDADVLCFPDTLTRIERAFQENPDAAAVIGSYDDDPPEQNVLSLYKNLTHHFVHQSSSTDASTFWTACGAIRRDNFVKMDGFDESFARPSIEDIELGYRLRNSGSKIILCKDVTVKHAKRWTISSLLRSDISDRAIPWTMLQLSSGGILNDLNTTRAQRTAAVSAYLGLLGAALSFWRGWLVLVPLACFLTIAYINLPLYRFYLKRGAVFAGVSILMHWFYYFYSVVGFCIGLAKSQFQSKNPEPTQRRLSSEIQSETSAIQPADPAMKRMTLTSDP
jgi:glycosyltransferase involved in cell wall biosynthesis